MNYIILLVGSCIIFYIGGKLLMLISSGGPLFADGNSNDSKVIDDKKDILSEAKRLKNSGHYEKAVELLESVVNCNGNDFSAFLYLAQSYAAVGYKIKAIDAYHQCVRLGANYAVYQGLFQMYCEVNYFHKAIPFLKAIYEKQSSSDYLCLLLGLAYLNTGDVQNCEGVLAVMNARGTKKASELAQYIDQYEDQKSQTSNQSSHHSFKRFYDVLEVGVGASQSELRQAYRELSKVWHPDRFSHDPKLQLKAEQKMRAINQAYSVLNRS